MTNDTQNQKIEHIWYSTALPLAGLVNQTGL